MKLHMPIKVKMRFIDGGSEREKRTSLSLSK